MTEVERRRLRASFDEVAELYDRVRPAYPAGLFDDLMRLGDLRSGSRVLEVGCGTGQATVSLAERGLEILCVELGGQLARIARRNLGSFPSVDVVNANFETWETAEEFDAVVAFTAMHWIDPEIRYAKPARLLREAGVLAVVQTNHVLPEAGDPFFADVQDDYDAVAPDPDNRPPPRPEEVETLSDEIESSGLLRAIAVERYLWDIEYSADEYIGVLDTYSGHRALDEKTRHRLYERIRQRIAARPEKSVRKSYLATLNLAKRL